MPIIEVSDLKKVYRVGTERVVALSDVNFVVQKGEICCIVGHSGSGKSTLLNQMAGLEKPTKGKIIISKTNVCKLNENQLADFRQRELGFVFQSYNLLPTLTALENVALPLMFKGISEKKRNAQAMKLLKSLGLDDRAKHKPTEMSGGQQQRVGIARAFIGNPAVVFADEPTGNLDSTTTVAVLKTISELVSEHKVTFIMVSHERDLIRFANRIITIHDGKIIGNEVNGEAL